MSKGYLGNELLKAQGDAQPWTNEQVQEFIQCSKDPIYFAEKYIQIVHVDKGLIPIRLYDYQKEILDKIIHNRRVAALTARQAGKTTTAVAIILHYVLFNEHKTVGILSNKGEGAMEVLDRVKIAYEALPKWLQQGIVEWNKKSIELENGCKVYTGTTTSSSIRGKSISFLYVDEAAFIDGWDEFFASVYPTISSGDTTKLMLTSTPNGLNHYHKICVGAQEKVNGYEYVEVKWDRVPGRDEKWKQETLQALNYDYGKFSQEYEVEFQGSSGTLLDGATLKALRKRDPIHNAHGLTVYEAPQKGRTYVLVADVSRGKGLDYSAFHVIDVTQMPYRQAAVYRDNLVTPVDYSSIIHRTATNYNEALVLVEINDIGGQVADSLHNDFEYEGILYTEGAGRAGKRISGGFGGSSERGIRTTKTVKAIGCSMLKLLAEQKQIEIVDEHTISELETFSKKGVSYEAEPGRHDDLVMGLVLFGWLTGQPFFKEITDINTLARLRDRADEDYDDMLPFAFTYDDVPESQPVFAHQRENDWFGGW